VVVTGSAPPGGAEELRRHDGGHGPIALMHEPIGYAELVAVVRRAASAGGS
jgi:hypothetical protein